MVTAGLIVFYILGVVGASSVFRSVDPDYRQKLDFVPAFAWPFVFPVVGLIMLVGGGLNGVLHVLGLREE